jgi:hypothetical protein
MGVRIATGDLADEVANPPTLESTMQDETPRPAQALSVLILERFSSRWNPADRAADHVRILRIRHGARRRCESSRRIAATANGTTPGQ